MSTTIFAYILASSSNPDKIDCVVPWRVNENEIFFGPCKKRLRKYLKREYLKDSEEVNVDEHNLYIIGFNGANSKNERKIVWLGKIEKLCTFKKAFEITSKEHKYKKMFEYSSSPVNLEPIFDLNNNHCGYKIKGEEHKSGNAWLGDFSSKRNKIYNQTDNGYHFAVNEKNDLDLCIFLKNIHFAKNSSGIKIDDTILQLLHSDQIQSEGIDKYNVFGVDKNGKTKGLAGSYLTTKNPFAHELVEYIKALIDCDESNS